MIREGLRVIIIVDERQMVTQAYEASFGREGIASMGFGPADFNNWVESAAMPDLEAVEAFILGDCAEREDYPRQIRNKTRAPVIALSENPGLEQTLKIFAAGVDDVVRKPVHVREIMARVEAIRRRREDAAGYTDVGDIRVFSNGCDPVVKGEVLLLPRRERRILEYLVSRRGRLVSKAQIFSSIYGIFDEDVQENVIESHISKLRKKLRNRLGFDPIESKRYLGYRLIAEPVAEMAAADSLEDEMPTALAYPLVDEMAC
jgi:DNA-binding response OmpR family regulator